MNFELSGRAARAAAWARALRGAIPALCLSLVALAAPAQVQPTEAVTRYGYDEAGNKTSQTDAKGRTTRWEFDANHRVTSRTLPDGTQESNGYDSEGNLTAKTTFAGERLTFHHDFEGKVTRQVVPAGVGSNAGVAAGSALFRYLPGGALASQSESGPTTLDGERTYRYDVMDQLLEVKGPTGQITYARDAGGLMTERSVAGAGTARYAYDAAGRMTRVVAPDGKETTYDYDAAGRLERIVRELRPFGGQPQTLFTHYAYDAAGRVMVIGHVRRRGDQMQLIVGQVLKRGRGGAIERIITDRGTGAGVVGTPLPVETEEVRTFEYDGLGRLVREWHIPMVGDGTDTCYEYDLTGNRSRKVVITPKGHAITTYAHDVADRLLEEVTTLSGGGTRSVAYTWDANGNLASRSEAGSVTLYRFDPLNRLIDIRKGATRAEAEGASPHVRYAYDAEGNRVRKWKGDEGRTYLIDEEERYTQVVREAGSTGSIDYLRGVGLVRQTATSAAGVEELFPLLGHLGTSLGSVGIDGEEVERVRADAFGVLNSSSPVNQTHLFAGEYWDPDAQLLYLRARWYDPALGRFVSADPLEGRPTDPRSLNRYAYADGDSVNNSDPTGRETLQSQLEALNMQLQTMAKQISVQIGRGNMGPAGVLRNDLGRLVEKGVNLVVRTCGRGKTKITKTAKPGTGDVDFLLIVKNQVFKLEAKYQFPKNGSDALGRLVAQVNRHGGDTSEKLAVFFGKEVGPRAFGNREHMLASLTRAGSEPHLMINGFFQLAAWLAEAAGEACL